MTLHTLYRFYAADDTLLYIGITCNPGRRFDQHGDQKSWWRDVARIEMEQHPDRETLRTAERAAIQSEMPAHNIRMNGSPKPQSLAAATSTAPSFDGLIGRWFHSWIPDDRAEEETHDAMLYSRGGLRVQWQGEVVDRDEFGSFYLVQTYSWWDGSAHSQIVVTPDDVKEWTFYVSAIEMQTSLGCSEIGKHGGSGRCGREVTHYIETDWLGTVLRCADCIEYYAGSPRELVWRDGHPETR